MITDAKSVVRSTNLQYLYEILQNLNFANLGYDALAESYNLLYLAHD